MRWSPTRRSDEQHLGAAANQPAGEQVEPREVAAGEIGAEEAGQAAQDGPPAKARRPLYHRLLRLRHISPSPWQRAAFADAPLVVAVVLVLADLASAWTLLALPLAVAVVVKSHDLLAGVLTRPPGPPRYGPP